MGLAIEVAVKVCVRLKELLAGSTVRLRALGISARLVRLGLDVVVERLRPVARNFADFTVPLFLGHALLLDLLLSLGSLVSETLGLLLAEKLYCTLRSGSRLGQWFARDAQRWRFDGQWATRNVDNFDTVLRLLHVYALHVGYQRAIGGKPPVRQKSLD